MAKVTIGGNERVLAPFSAAKAMEAAALVSEIVEQGNGVLSAMDDYATAHMQRNTTEVPRAAVFFRDPARAAQIPPDAWEASGNMLALPGARPSFEEQLLAVFPQLFRVARGQVLKLLALVIVDERELEQADTQGGADGIEELLTTKGRELLYEAQMHELFGLGKTAWEVCQQQLKADPTALALLGQLKQLRSSGQTTSASSEQGSSTASQQRTGGRAKKSSSASRGERSKPSTVSS